ncbi:MAG: ribosome maturation factor RimP [Parvibaculum sp.]|uniref:ribosome maturation factor RimP n=1 Tax=Parvibaculum sp. TaxID=2024848 RepID=UPI00283F7685|nr:ribosome maturation factor RimP [Parvibaculum sp.]MDR3500737.1 ribosome maturation factor RimP [Parvibaculum sp.]
MAGLGADRQEEGGARADRLETLDTHLIAAHGQSRKVFDLIRAPAEAAGFEIVRVRYGLHDGHTLQIMAERADGSMKVADCETLSNLLSAILDVEDPIAGEYNLEVSSAGIDRPLTRPKDFERWQGFETKIELSEAIDGRKRFRGILHGFENGEVLIEHDVEGFSEPQVIGLPFRQVGEAKLTMSDDLIRESLKRRDREGPSDGE